RVSPGQVAPRIDPSEVQAAVHQQEAAVAGAQANYTNAQVRYRRVNSLYKQGFIAAQDVDDARTQVEVQLGTLNAAKAQLRNVQAQLSDTVLRSPINGFITARAFDPGSIVAAGQPIVTVQALRKVYVTSS